jgi:hypothetical protein
LLSKLAKINAPTRLLFNRIQSNSTHFKPLVRVQMRV